MLKNIKTTTSSDVIYFPDISFRESVFDQALMSLDEALDGVIEEGWKLSIKYFFINYEKTGITKRQQTIPADREFRFAFLMPVPGLKQSAYGLSEKLFPKIDKSKVLESAYALEVVNFTEFTSLNELFFSCVEKNVKLLRQKGVKLGNALVH